MNPIGHIRRLIATPGRAGWCAWLGLRRCRARRVCRESPSPGWASGHHRADLAARLEQAPAAATRAQHTSPCT